MRILSAILGVALCLLVAVPSAHAHDVDQGYVYFSILDEQIDVRVELNVRDVNKAVGLGLPEDGSLTPDAVQQFDMRLRDYVLANLSLRPDGQSVPLNFLAYALRDTEYGQFLMLDLRLANLPRTPEVVDIEYGLIFAADDNHRGFALIENDWRTQVYENEARYSLVFSPDDTAQQLDFDDASVLSGILGMIENGTHHILIGIDHLLFLFALLIPAVMVRNQQRWEGVGSLQTALWQVVKIVTMFTVGHSITLALAALGVVSLSARLVESVIAASIAVAAFDILYPVLQRRILLVIFLFGLMHGFGFANVLAEMPIPQDYVVPSLFGFNVGVELGQLAVVVVIVPLLYLVRNSQLYVRYAMPAGAVGLILIAMYWFIERAFLIDLPAGAIIQDVLGLR